MNNQEIMKMASELSNAFLEIKEPFVASIAGERKDPHHLAFKEETPANLAAFVAATEIMSCFQTGCVVGRETWPKKWLSTWEREIVGNDEDDEDEGDDEDIYLIDQIAFASIVCDVIHFKTGQECRCPIEEGIDWRQVMVRKAMLAEHLKKKILALK